MDRAGGARQSHVAVVVLSWNGRQDTMDCLSSLRELRYNNATIVVVDNGSSDGTSEAVASAHPEVHLLRSDKNVGFAAGNNLGLRQAFEIGADYAFLLNNDTVADPDLLSRLVGEAQARSDAGALCPLVYYAHPPDMVWYAGARFDPGRGHNGRQTGYRSRDRGQYRGVREVERATGAAMLVPRPVLREVGLFDEELFLHVEDADWSLRARARGYRIYLVPEARLWHKVSVDSGGEHSPTLAYYAVRNTLAVCNRHAPMSGLPALRRHIVTLAAHLAHTRRAEHPVENLRSVIEGWRDYRRGRLGPRGAPAARRSDNLVAV